MPAIDAQGLDAHGRIVKTTGDGLLLELQAPSMGPVAVEMEQAVSRQNTEMALAASP